MSDLSDPNEPAEPSDEAVLEDWRKVGRCSACTHFVVDYGDAPDLYGHCKIYPRSGSREAADYACPEYKPLDGFAKLTGSTRQPKSIDGALNPRAAQAMRMRRQRQAAASARRRPDRLLRPVAVVRRRSDEATPARSTPEQSAPSGGLEAGVLAALTGQGDSNMDSETLSEVLVGLVENFIGIQDVQMASKWEGGELVIEPGDPELKGQAVPIETFFHKIVMIRDRLRVLEQKINANPSLSAADKVDLQQYISRCYGSLTSFNVLFRDRGDRFTSK